MFHNHTPRGLVSTDTQLVFAEGLNERISSSPQAPFENGSTRSRVLPLRVLVSRLKRFCVFPLGLFKQKAQGGSVRHSTLLSESGDARCEPGLSRLRNQPRLLWLQVCWGSEAAPLPAALCVCPAVTQAGVPPSRGGTAWPLTRVTGKWTVSRKPTHSYRLGSCKPSLGENPGGPGSGRRGPEGHTHSHRVQAETRRLARHGLDRK